MLWVLGFILSFCGLFIWLEYGTMFPRSGGEKVYLEAVYKKPRSLATVIFAANAILLGFSASNCIVFASKCVSSFSNHRSHELNVHLSILVAADQPAGRWETRGIALGGISKFRSNH